MQFGEAFLSLIPQLDRSAVARTDAEAHRAGQSAGRAYADGMDKGTKSASDRAGAFGTALATMGAKATIGAAGVASVAPAALQLAAAVVPATGAIVALPAALLAVKAVSSVVKIAVGGVGDAIKESFVGNAQKAAKALEALPPEANKFALSIIGMKGGVEDLRFAISDGLFAPINRELDSFLAKALPLANRVLPEMSAVLGETGAEFLRVATNGRLLDDVDTLFRNTTASIRIANDSTGTLTDAFGALISVGSASLPRLATGFRDGANAAGEFVLQAEKTGQLDQWMNAGFKTLGQLFQILKNLGSVLASVLKAAGDSSRNFLGTIVDLTAKLAAFLKTAEGTSALKNFFTVTGGISQALRQGLMLILPQLGKALAILAPAVQPLIGAFLQLVAAAAPLLPVAARLAVVIASVLAGAMTTLANTLTPMIAKLTGGGSAGEGMEKLSQSAEKLGPAINDAASSVQDLGPALNLTASALAFMITHTDTIVKLLPYIAAGFLAWKVAQVAGNVAMAASVPIRIAEIIATRQQTAALTQLAAAQVANTGATVTNTVAERASLASRVASRVATIAHSVATGIATAATWLWTAATTALGVAIKFALGPVGLIIIGITALIAILVLAYKHNETFRKIVDTVWKAIKIAIAATVDWFVNTAWPALKTAITFLGDLFMQLWRNYLVPAWNGIKIVVEGAWNVIKVVFDGYVAYLKILGQIFTWLWQNIINPVWQGIKLSISIAWAAIKIIFDAIVVANRVVGAIFTWLWQNVVVPVWSGIRAVISAQWAVIKAVFDAIMAAIRVVASVMQWFHTNVVVPVWNNIKSTISIAWNIIKGIWNLIVSYLRDTFANAWHNFQNMVKAVWQKVSSDISGVWTSIKNNVFTPMVNLITQTLPNAFSRGVSAIKSAWDKVKEAAAAPVRFVVNTVLNNGLIKGFNWISSKVGGPQIGNISLGFADGGVLPGYTPGRDVHRFTGAAGTLNLSGGEAILRPELTRELGAEFVYAGNKAARSGQAKNFVTNFLGGEASFEDGGILGKLKDVGGGILGGISKAWDTFTNPAEAFKSAVNGLMGGLSGGPLIKGMLTSAVGRLVEHVSSWITSKFNAFVPTLTGGPTGAGSGGALVAFGRWLQSQGYSVSEHPAFGGVTPGAHVNGSKHYVGRAIDVNHGAGTSAAEQRALAAIIPRAHALGLHSIFMSAGHYNHAHFDYNQGGIFKYDNGGWFNPGQIGVNHLRRPEAVLTPAESEGLKAMGTDELVDLLREIRDAVKENGHTVGGYIKGSGKGMVRAVRQK